MLCWVINLTHFSYFETILDKQCFQINSDKLHEQNVNESDLYQNKNVIQYLYYLFMKLLDHKYSSVLHADIAVTSKSYRSETSGSVWLGWVTPYACTAFFVFSARTYLLYILYINICVFIFDTYS